MSEFQYTVTADLDWTKVINNQVQKAQDFSIVIKALKTN